MRAITESLTVPATPRAIYEEPFPPSGYRGLCMVAEDGTLLVEIRVHVRAQEQDLVPWFRAWLARIEQKEQPVADACRLTLITPDDVEKVF